MDEAHSDSIVYNRGLVPSESEFSCNISTDSNIDDIEIEEVGPDEIGEVHVRDDLSLKSDFSVGISFDSNINELENEKRLEMRDYDLSIYRGVREIRSPTSDSNFSVTVSSFSSAMMDSTKEDIIGPAGPDDLPSNFSDDHSFVSNVIGQD